MSTKEFDVVVVGSGPGGYVAAIRCSQLGMKTAIIEKYSTLGGTCLNVGCIPSKAYLDSSERFHQTLHSHALHGIDVKDVKLNFEQMKKRVKAVVSQTCDGVAYLMKKNKIEVFQGIGSFVSEHEISIDGKETIKAKKIILATGSKPVQLPFAKIDKKRIITSTEALDLSEVPKHLVVVGGGVIGLELGQVYRRLGSEVSVIEYAPNIIGMMDHELGKGLQRVMKKEGINFYLAHQVKEVVNLGKKVSIKALDQKKNKELTLEADYCLVSTGRRPYADLLNLKAAGLETDERGRVPVNDHLQTKKPHIYAIGDLVRGAMLAHKAEEEGVFVAETLAGQSPHINYNLIPGVVYTWPEVASVGQTEEQLKEAKIPYKKGSFPFKALGRARASEESDGFIKILSHEATDEILGVHMFGPRVADLIAEAVVAMEYRASAEDIARMSHAHPTFAEAIKEAALDAHEKRPLHL